MGKWDSFNYDWFDIKQKKKKNLYHTLILLYFNHHKTRKDWKKFTSYLSTYFFFYFKQNSKMATQQLLFIHVIIDICWCAHFKTSWGDTSEYNFFFSSLPLFFFWPFSVNQDVYCAVMDIGSEFQHLLKPLFDRCQKKKKKKHFKRFQLRNTRFKILL